jgi:CHAT domain
LEVNELVSISTYPPVVINASNPNISNFNKNLLVLFLFVDLTPPKFKLWVGTAVNISVQNLQIPIQNPMMRSGLAFAGVNTWLAGGSLPKEAGKGFALAQDIAALDLQVNEITVLCACDTAIGDIKIGEGVFGLRRAFAIAGSKTLIMSLWSVPDKASALLL